MVARVANNESDNKARSMEVCKRTTMSLEMRKDDKREPYVKLAEAGNAALDLNLGRNDGPQAEYAWLCKKPCRIE